MFHHEGLIFHKSITLLHGERTVQTCFAPDKDPESCYAEFSGPFLGDASNESWEDSHGG